jgi:hypothetical protein
MKEKTFRLSIVMPQCVIVCLGALLLASLGAAARTQGQSIVQHSATPTPTPKVAGHPPSPPRPTPAPKVAGRPSPTPTPRPTVGHVVQARLAASRSGSASCPAQENFSGTITANGASEVTYTWVSFDGGTWPQGTLHFSGPGTQRVSEQVKLGAAGQVIHGWMQLKVLSPNGMLSPRALYTVNCAGGQTAGHVVRAQLTASRSASASCPMQENFNGTITTNGAAQVTYTWTSSDNSTWPQGTLRFASAGTQAVRETWKLGAAGQTANGWVRLKVLSPNAYMSNLAQFSFRCP